jgi:hypothetical protein
MLVFAHLRLRLRLHGPLGSLSSVGFTEPIGAPTSPRTRAIGSGKLVAACVVSGNGFGEPASILR